MQDLKDEACIYILLKPIQTESIMFVNNMTMVVTVQCAIKNMKCVFVE